MSGLKVADLFDEELVFVDFEASDSKDLLNKLYKKVFDKGYVKESFIDGILERELKYPTGLETLEIRVAIPHTDAIHVNKSCITVAKLKNPVNFKNMADGKTDIPVSLVFMLAVNEPKDQVTVLQQVIGLFSKEEEMKKFKESKTPKDILNVVFEGVK